MTTLLASDFSTGGQDAFPLLHRDVQEQLYRMEWEDLRPIQSKAIHAILQGNKHVIITAPTAGGKTEAAFLPIISRVLSDKDNGLSALYVGPLKALINDQFFRLESMCEELEIPVCRWHGDVSSTSKRKLLNKPSGILLITPESIESILLNQTGRLNPLFNGLKFIVIDELHSFFSNERGAQLRSQLSRIGRYCHTPPRLIALSATIGDMNLAAEWLNPGKGTEIEILQDTGAEQEVKIGVGAYGLAPDIDSENDDDDVVDRLVNDLFRHFTGRKALIFGNQKARIEEYADAVKSEAARRGVADNFLVHHGSLSKLEREDTEEELKSDRKVAVFCSSTLELGIDIGPVELVGQLGCTTSVNSFLQRLGRSGRRKGQPAAMRLYYVANHDKEAPLTDRLHLELVMICAICELVAKRWCESPRPQALHLSTLVHQILSVIAELGGIKAKPLFEALVVQGAFPGISQAQFAEILRSLAGSELIEQDKAGLLLLGRIGEIIARRYDFYAVFQTPDEFSVRHEHRTIGSVDYIAGPGSLEFLILSGKRWQIVSVDTEAKVLQVVPSRGRKKPSYRSSLAYEIDDIITQMMHDVLSSGKQYPYCDRYAEKYLNDARHEAEVAVLATESLIQEGKDLLWFTWKGSRSNRTILLILKKLGINAIEKGTGVIACQSCTDKQLLTTLSTMQMEAITTDSLATMQELIFTEKYDRFLPVELWRYQFGINSLDLFSAKHSITTLLHDANEN